jgi:hypothetical protein
MTASLRPLLGLAVLSVALVACSAGGAATAPPTASPPPSAAPSASPDAQNGAPVDPGPGVADSELVEPQPGQQNVLSIPIEKLEATAEGRTVTITAHWSSGVAPCSVLDQVLLNVGDETIDVTIREGTSDPDAMCVLMLQSKRTIVSLEVEPGTYTVRDSEGLAPPVEVTVS